MGVLRPDEAGGLSEPRTEPGARAPGHLCVQARHPPWEPAPGIMGSCPQRAKPGRRPGLQVSLSHAAGSSRRPCCPWGGALTPIPENRTRGPGAGRGQRRRRHTGKAPETERSRKRTDLVSQAGPGGCSQVPTAGPRGASPCAAPGAPCPLGVHTDHKNSTKARSRKGYSEGAHKHPVKDGQIMPPAKQTGTRK